MDTSLDGSTPNASLSSMSSTASLTSMVPANSTQDPSTQSTSQLSSVPSSTASPPIVPSHTSSLPVSSNPPSVRSAAVKPDAVSSSSTTDKADSTPTNPPAPAPSDPPTPTSKPLKSSTNGHTSHITSPTSSRAHAPNASSTHAPVTPTTQPPPAPTVTSKPTIPPKAQSSPQVSQTSNSQPRASEARASQKPSTPSILDPKESATASSGTSSNIIAPSSSINSTGSSSEARTTSDTSVKNTSPNALITDFSSLASNTPLFPTSSEVSSPTGLLTTNNATSGFFANHGAVAGVFVVVGLAALGLLGFLIFTLFRRCRRYDGYVEDREPSLPNLDAENSEVEPHYRRMSQVIAFGNVLSAGAPGVGSRAGRRPRSYVGSDASHARSNDTYHSGVPIVRSEKNPFSNFHMAPSSFPGNTDAPPYNYPAYPFRSASRYSQQSVAESSPSVYPPSLPLVNDDDEHWRYRERAPSPGVSQDTTDEQDIVRQQPTPPYSSLGLWTTGSLVTATPQNASQNDIRKAFDHRMELSVLDKDNTAPTLPPLAHIHSSEDRHILDSTWTVPSRGGRTPYI